MLIQSTKEKKALLLEKHELSEEELAEPDFYVDSYFPDHMDMEEMEDIFTKLCIVNLIIKFSPLMLKHFYDFSVPSDNMDLY